MATTKKTQKIAWWRPKIEKENYVFLKKALDLNYINEGPLTAAFEKEICELTGAKYAVATNNCTAAMFLSLRALGIGQGDEVIVPDITFIATANAVSLSGAKPVLVDVRREDLTMDPLAFQKAITERTKAVIPVHVSGRSAEIEEIMNVASKRGIKVIEDAAETIGSYHKGKHLGRFGITGCFSFAANKTISTGQGGMVVTDNEEIYLKLRPLINQGRTKLGTGGDDIHNTIGFNFRMTDLQAAMGLGQLKHIKERAKKMRHINELYRKNLTGLDGFRLYPVDTKGPELLQWTDAFTLRRDELVKYLGERNIDCRNYWMPLHRQMAYRAPDDEFPASTYSSPRSLWLPSAFDLKEADILRVCAAIKEFFP
ncbi:MAG: DegT/DnrJ/EryC1/StrS family aminotransferase [Candidatus Taylorbacteria bacterium]|nr:DegT/DnrJ/EryC1/StrS family aminotransferase [Candidatus Taylorbacteria bacterium]